jgi:hypothetical protein
MIFNDLKSKDITKNSFIKITKEQFDLWCDADDVLALPIFDEIEVL